jgi:hypothetical protein
MTNTKNFHFTEFDGIAPYTYRGYVIFNTARHAWEDRKFELRCVPEGWKRKLVLSLTGQQLIIWRVERIIGLI